MEDYLPEPETESSSEEYDIIEHTHDEAMKKLIQQGGLRVETIIEIRYLMELIRYVPDNYKDKQEPIAKCLELIINLANKYLELYDKNILSSS